MIKTILALIFALILGVSLTYLPFVFIPIRWEFWAAIAGISVVGLILCLYFSREKEEIPDSVEEFQNEIKQVIRAHLKISILFWSYYYKKEKVKTLDEAKREVFQDLKKEFIQVPWMESVLEEIRNDLTKYK